MKISTGILTVSDRAKAGVYRDQSGPALRAAALGYGWQVASERLVPDEVDEIRREVQALVSSGCQLILTTGGTGVGQRDVTPEALRSFGGKEIPGFGEAMRSESRKLTPHAILSRAMAVAVGRALVLCLPGNPMAAVECLGFVAESVPHCVEVLAGTGEGH